MNPDRNQNVPDQPDVVADMAEALAAGRPFPPLPEDITPEAREQLRGLQALLLLLDLDRRQPDAAQTPNVGGNPTLIIDRPIEPLQKLGATTFARSWVTEAMESSILLMTQSYIEKSPSKCYAPKQWVRRHHGGGSFRKVVRRPSWSIRISCPCTMWARRARIATS